MKDQQTRLVPKLRFPEFHGAGAWTTEKLGTVATISSTKVGNNVCVPMSITSGVGLVSQEDKFGRVIAGDSYKNYLVLRPNEFAYNKSATKEYPEGFLTLYSGTKLAAVPNSIFTCFRINGDSPDVRFLNYQFLGNLHGRWLRQFIQVGARAHGSLSIHDNDLMALPVPVPAGTTSVDEQLKIAACLSSVDELIAAQAARAHGSLSIYDNDLMALPVPVPAGTTSVAEQQKIADCLSSLDELIAAQARKVDALKAHKKGLMQQLFPREGETQPRLRLPEFQNAGEWEESELGPKTNKVGSGITPTGGDKNYKPSGRPFVRSQNVGWGILLLDDVAYIDEETHASFSSTEIKVSDVLLNITGASIGRSAVADYRIAAGNVNQHVCIIRTKPDELNPLFLNQFLISQLGQKQIDSFQAGGNRQGLNFAQIRSFAMPLPPSPAEQHRIASYLSSLDALITAETQKLEALKTHKRGLMQQFFPVMEDA